MFRAFKKRVRSYVFQHSYRDPRLAETVSRTTSSELTQELGYDGMPVHYIPKQIDGLVLQDSRGRGSSLY